MLVMCINDKWHGKPVDSGLKHPQVGDIDEVDKVVERGIAKYYQLHNYGNDRGFLCDYFAVLPDSSADEMAQESKEAIANLETVLV